MIDQTLFDALVDHLHKLAKRERFPQFETRGICCEVNKFTVWYSKGEKEYDLKGSIFARWPECYGISSEPNTVYPVAGLIEFWRGDNKWGRTPNGYKRRSLCLWLADNLKPEELEE